MYVFVRTYVHRCSEMKAEDGSLPKGTSKTGVGVSEKGDRGGGVKKGWCLGNCK